MEGVSGSLNNRLVFLAFLHQSDCGAYLRRELDSLGRELNITRVDGSYIEPVVEDGELQTDGHSPSSIKMQLIGDVQLLFEQPINPVEALALQEAVARLREIGDELEYITVAQASSNLVRKLLSSPVQRWKAHLTKEVEWVLKKGQSVLLEHLPHEQVIMALTLILMKGVCDTAPQLLRNLFNTALEYINTRVSG